MLRKIVTVLLSISLVVTPLAFHAFAQEDVAEKEARLRAELDKVLADIEAQKKILSEKQKEGASYERDVAILTAQINQAKLKIKAKEISIQQLGKDINTKTERIQLLGEKAEQGRDSLSQLIRKTQYIDDFNLAEIVLSDQNLSEFLQDLDSYYFIKDALNQSLDVVKKTKTETEIERTGLDNKRAQEIDNKISIEAEKRTIEKSEAEKKRLLNLSKAEQQSYQGVIKTKEAQAAAIRAALFSLRDTAAIPFGTALEYANLAQARTGVRAAFILGILTQESDLGKNIGTCNRPGDPPEKSWKQIMPGTADKASGASYRDDQTIFLQITSELGLDPDTTPLSCPMGGGWGGAMGPSQFIPSTWKSIAPRIQAITGDFPSPWNPRDAILATAIYVSDLGAGAGGYTAERTAALKYYAGGNWAKPQNAFYGDQVMAKTTNIQENMINPLQSL